MQRLQQRLIASLVVLAIVGYPLVSIVPTFTGLDSRISSVIFRAIVLFLSLVVAAWTFVPFHKKVRVSLPMLSFLLCWGVLLLRYAHDVVLLQVEPSPSLDAVDFFVFIVGVSLVPTLPLFRSLTTRMLQRVQHLLFWLVAVVVTVYSIHFANPASDAGFVRAQADALNAITYGSLGAILILLTFTYSFSPRSRLPRLARWIAFGIGAYALYSSASRGPIVALAIPLFMLVKNRIRAFGLSGPAAWITTFIGTLALASVVAMAIFSMPSTRNLADSNFLVHRLLNASEDDSTQQRIYLIESSWNIFLNNPFLGGAIAEPETKAYPHNVILEGLMVGGIPLGMLVLAIEAYSIWLAGTYLQTRDERTFIGALLMFAVVMTMISGSLYTGPEFWYIFAIASASRRSFRDRSSTSLFSNPTNSGALYPSKVSARMEGQVLSTSLESSSK
jgi:hypothetical protein